jgi:hypothetical protein
VLRWVVGGPWPGWEGERLATAVAEAEGAAGGHSPLWWLVLTTSVFGFLVVLSRRPLLNLFSRRQLMNASFNRWHLVNAYGAFGSMTTVRRELIIEGTASTDPGEEDWLPYEFHGKPGDVRRRSRQFAPYHLRLDWLMWFLALGSWYEVWFERFLGKLLDGDPAIRRLLRVDPFDGEAPALLRVRLFEYRYASAEERRATGQWWVREELGTLVPPRSRSSRG